MIKDVEFDLTSSDSNCNDSLNQVQDHLCHIFLLYNLSLRVLGLYFNPNRMCGSEGLFFSLNDFQRFRVKKTCCRIVHLDSASTQMIPGLFNCSDLTSPKLSLLSVLLIQLSSAI